MDGTISKKTQHQIRIEPIKAYLVCMTLVLSSCFEPKQESSEKIAPTPASGAIALAIGGDIPQDPPPPEFNCVFNGSTVINGDSVTAFLNSSVQYGAACVSENRICRDAVLSGTYAYSTCAVDAPKSCLFDGQTIAHGNAITAFTSSSVTFGSSCTDVAQVRTCNDGALSGNAQYAICRVDEPRACLFDGRTLMHGETVQAFATSTTEFGGECTTETRQCNDGTLSGSYAYSSCSIDQPASCLFDGQTIPHNSSVVAFESSRADFGQTCVSQTRSCVNGQLSGTYSNATCVVNEPAHCQFNGATVSHGESVIAYNVAQSTETVNCLSEVRSCTNGVLSGSFINTACVTPPPVIPPDPTPELGCMVNGKEIASGASVTLFMNSQVVSPAVCESELRECKNGVLSGSATAETCEQINPQPPIDPLPPVDPNPPGQCSLDGLVWEFPNECSEKCHQKIGFLKSRISRDGGKTWLDIKGSTLPEDLNAVWNYLLKKYGRNQCDRPNVRYFLSDRIRSLLVMDSKVIPKCDVCKFKEFTVIRSTQNMCSHKKKRATSTVIKFVCEEPKKSCDHKKHCDHKECEHKNCDHKTCNFHKHKDKRCDKKVCKYSGHHGEDSDDREDDGHEGEHDDDDRDGRFDLFRR
jgi:hypothetical protein